MKENIRGVSVFGTSASLNKSGPLRETQSAQRATIAKICEEGMTSAVIKPYIIKIYLLTDEQSWLTCLWFLNLVGLQKIIQLLTSEESDVQIHAVKVIANLAAEGGVQYAFRLDLNKLSHSFPPVWTILWRNFVFLDWFYCTAISLSLFPLVLAFLFLLCFESVYHLTLVEQLVSLNVLISADINQEKIVEEGGLDALLTMLKSSQNATILRVASGAIANLAMNGNSDCQSSLSILCTLNLANAYHWWIQSFFLLHF